ncbi:MAG: hypothetical protein AB7G08_32995 [Hyphomicrobiaceae bacterium]
MKLKVRLEAATGASFPHASSLSGTAEMFELKVMRQINCRAEQALANAMALPQKVLANRQGRSSSLHPATASMTLQ